MSDVRKGYVSIHREIVDLENEIYEDIDKPVDLKAEITKMIKSVKDPMGQLVLEKRYLCYEKWEQIAVELGLSTRQVYRVHDRAMEEMVALKGTF